MSTLFTGDIRIHALTDPEDLGNYDVVFTNGQPSMTGGFDTAVLLAVHGDKKTWQNALARSEDEKFISDFPDVIDRGVVSEETKNDGAAALRRALQFLVSSGAAKSVEVVGQITSVFGVSWSVEITRPDDTLARYAVTAGTKNRWAANWKSYETQA